MASKDLSKNFPEWSWFASATRTVGNAWPFIWLVVRVYLGWQWLHAGWGKVTNPAWMDGQGKALAGYTQNAIDASTGDVEKPLVAYDWWVSILKIINAQAGWIAPIVAVAEVVVGVALILGAFTGLVSIIGLMMNFSFVLSGTAGVNPVYILLGLALLAAWRNAGWIGLDRWLLPALGTPDKPGKLLAKDRVDA